MKLQSLLTIAIITLSSQVNSTPLYKLAQGSLAMNQCPLNYTDEHWDLALVNKGFFVVATEQNDKEHYFTRYGKLYVDKENYLRTDANEYVLGVDKQNNQLDKIKIPSKPMTAKATTLINYGINLPSRDTSKSTHITTATEAFDDKGNANIVVTEYAKIADRTWRIKVQINGIDTPFTGTLSFDQLGKLSSQEGLDQVQFQAHGTMLEFKIHYDANTTQYNIPFYINNVTRNGYPKGRVQQTHLSMDGEISILYTNGQSRKLKKRIAVALFTHPEALQHVSQHLYASTDQSGKAAIYWANSERSMLEGCLEEETCLTH